MGDRLATTDMGRKLGEGACAPFWRGGTGSPSNTMWPGHVTWAYLRGESRVAI